MDAEWEQQVLDEVMALDKQWREGQREQNAGAPLGMTQKVSDAEFYAFCVSKIRVQPLWAMALAFVDGGEDYLKRFTRIQERVLTGGRP